MPAIMTMLADHAARQLLDFNQKLDINLLDNVVNCLYHGEGAQVRWTWNTHLLTMFNLTANQLSKINWLQEQLVIWVNLLS